MPGPSYCLHVEEDGRELSIAARPLGCSINPFMSGAL